MTENAQEEWCQTIYLRYCSDEDTRILFDDGLSANIPLLDQLKDAVRTKLPSPALYRVVIKRQDDATTIAFEKLGGPDEACAMAFYEKDESGHCQVTGSQYDPPDIVQEPRLAQALAFGLAEQAKAQESGTQGFCFVTAAPR